MRAVCSSSPQGLVKVLPFVDNNDMELLWTHTVKWNCGNRLNTTQAVLSGEAPTLEVNVGQMWLSGLDSNFGLTTVAGDERQRQQEQQEREIVFEREQRNTKPRGLRKRNAIICARASGWEDGNKEHGGHAYASGQYGAAKNGLIK